MKKLTKDQEQQLKNYVKQFQVLDQHIDKAHQALLIHIHAYNDLVDEVNEFMAIVHDGQQEYFDERSDKWQEGANGQQYQEWMEVWSNSLDHIDEPVIHEPEHFEFLESLPFSADSL